MKIDQIVVFLLSFPLERFQFCKMAVYFLAQSLSSEFDEPLFLSINYKKLVVVFPLHLGSMNIGNSFQFSPWITVLSYFKLRLFRINQIRRVEIWLNYPYSQGSTQSNYSNSYCVILLPNIFSHPHKCELIFKPLLTWMYLTSLYPK